MEPLRDPTTISHSGPISIWQRLCTASPRCAGTSRSRSPYCYRAMRSFEKLQPTSSELRLRVVSSLGELLPDELIDWAAERLGVRLHDHYGQAETGVFVSNHQAVTLQFRRPPGSIGHQVPGFNVVILDAAGRQCPTDEGGEI